MTPFKIPTNWTAEQAMAVVDLLDELREHIWTQYDLRLLEAYREDRREETLSDDLCPPCDDPPF